MAKDRSSGPLISVIIPAYNAERFVREAISSAQDQTHRNVEILVVDDGSTDRTVPIVKRCAAEDPRVRLLRQSNQGVAAARNRAIRASTGEYIAPLDADDLWFPQKLERQRRRLEKTGPSAGLAYSWWMYVNNDSEIYRLAGRPTYEGDVLRAHLLRNFIGNASVPLIRRSSLERVGLYDESLRERGAEGCGDWDLTLRIAEHYDFCLVPDHLSAYRWERRKSAARGRSMSDNTDSMARSYRIVVNRVKRRHPSLSNALFRHSAANFFDYLATKAYENERYSKALRWLLKLARADAVVLLSVRAWGMAVKSLVWITIQPLSSRLDVDSMWWTTFKQWVRMPYNKLRDRRQERLLARTESTSDSVESSTRPAQVGGVDAVPEMESSSGDD